jgi:DNA-binding PadR family transcriptional regulator
MARNDPTEFLPVPDLHFQILLALAMGPAHGYSVGLEVEERTGGRVTPTTGGLYQALGRLQKNGLIRRVAAPADETDRRRIYHAVTALGREVADLETRRLASLVKLARRRDMLLDRG